MKFTLLFSILWLSLLPFSTLADDFERNCRSTSFGDQSFDVCDILFPSDNMAGERVYVRAWIPIVDHPVPAAVFLHTRGPGKSYYQEDGVSVDTAGRTYLDVIGVEEWLRREPFQSQPVAFFAPQDTFVQDDDGRLGNDYWLGSGGRDWESFLADELPAQIHSLYPQVRTHSWAVIGMSMGAHGSIKVGWDRPGQYPVVVSHSAVFQSTGPELFFSSDWDVFAPTFDESQGEHPTNEQMIGQNVGTRVLDLIERQSDFPLLNYWIDIHDKDFALLQPDYLVSAEPIWNYLVQRSEGENSERYVERSTYSVTNDEGHSLEYWQRQMERSFPWMHRQLYR